jgi:UDP-N-acetyl-D-mannosaminuronate dehydrogenase
MTTPADRLEWAIDGRAARVAVLGLGHAGLPVAETFAHAGFAVLGHDTDAGRFEADADHVRGPRDQIVPA